MSAGLGLLPGGSSDGSVWMGGNWHVLGIVWVLGAFCRILPDHFGVPEGNSIAGEISRHSIYQDSKL